MLGPPTLSAAADPTRAGGRWNAPGIYAIYGSIEPDLAADKVLQLFTSALRMAEPRYPTTHAEEVLSEDWRKVNSEPPFAFVIDCRDAADEAALRVRSTIPL
jgi:RES domain-containing protein